MRVRVFPLTGIDEELIRNAGMIDIMDGCSEQSSQDLQISKNSLKEEEEEKKKRTKIKLYRLKNVIMFYSSSVYLCERESESIHQEQAWREGRVWTE